MSDLQFCGLSNDKRTRAIAAIFLLLCANSLPAESRVFSAAVDWSNTENPNGPWKYLGNNGTILKSNLADWDPGGTFFSGQRAWAQAPLPQPNHVPAWFLSGEPSAIDLPGVGMHGAESAVLAWVGISWTSPNNGKATIAGGVWQAAKAENDGLRGNHRLRNSDWRLRLNDDVISSGNVSGTDSYSSSNLFTFAMGAKSNGPVSIIVAEGDELVLEFISPTSFASFNGVDLTITLTSPDAE